MRFEVDILDNDKRMLFKRKLEDNKKRLKDKAIAEQKKQIVDIVDNFSDKYKFVNEFELGRLVEFIDNLEFPSPAHIRLDSCEPSQHHNMYLCFLCGSEELLEIYLYGKYEDFMSDMDSWDMLSPYLLLIDEDFERYIYINDYGEKAESKIKFKP